MANIKSSAKRARQGARRHTRNASTLSALKTGQKKLRTAIASGKRDEAVAEFAKVSAVLDKAAKRGVIHKNSANRKKSAFNRALTGAK